MFDLLRARVRERLARRLGVPEIRFALERLAATGWRPRLIFDAGAYRGDFARACLQVWPGCAVACFEALETRASDLRALTDAEPTVRVFRCLLGAEARAEVPLHVSETGSSVLDEQIAQPFPIQLCPMRTVDEVVAIDYPTATPDFLKLDVQGYELEILKGAEAALPQLQVILMETNLLDIHRGARTSAMADLWVPIRAGSDIVFFGALVRHIIETNKYFREYVVHYTNASNILKNDFRDAEHGAGFFSGWNEEGQHYDFETWQFEGTGEPMGIQRDPTLEHPRCVFQALRRHYQRYTPEMVQKVCGIPPELFHKVADALTSNSGPDRTTAQCYAVGYTHQSKGAQIIRSVAVMQLLLGNIGRPGGGILALRGHASIQGSTDIPTLYDTLPGYLSMPAATKENENLAAYLKKYTQPTGLWHETPKYFISLLKAYYGKRATKENGFGYDWLPKLTGDHSHFEFVMRMCNHEVDGYLIMGQNPAVGSQNARLQRQSLSRVKWLVVRDLVEIESASFWYAAPEIERGEIRTEDIATEVFLMPAASHVEKEGAFTNTQRLLQWREKAVNPPGDAKSEAWFIHQLAKRLIARAHASDDPMDEPLRALDWWYPENEHQEPEAEAILAEINGWKTAPEPEFAPGVVKSQPTTHNPQPTTTSPPTTAASSTITSPSRTTARPPAAAGFTPAATPPTRSINAIAASRTAPTVTAGVSRGPATGASSTTAPAPPPTASPGASARSLFGGTKRKTNGPAPTCPISPRTKPPATSRPPARRASPPSRAINPSCCTPTARPGSTSPKAWRTARCPRITSRSNPR